MKTSFDQYRQTKQSTIRSENSDKSEREDNGDDQDSHHPTPSVARGLSDGKLKLFLSDIEESGGLDFCNFKDICNAKQDLYGEPDSAQRIQFKNKLRSLKRYSPEDYQLVLNERGVKSCRIASPKPQVVRSPETTKKPPKPRTTTPNTMPSTPLSSRAIALPGSYRSPPAPPSRGRRVDSDDFEDIMEESQDVDTPVIDIDLLHPERNREVLVYCLNEVEHEDCVYNCFNILLPVDPRDAMKDLCEAELVNEREILITMPALPWSLFRDTAKRNECLKAAGTHCPKLQMAQDIAVNAVERGMNGSRPTKQLLLRFPASVFLSNIFDGGARKLENHLQLEELKVQEIDKDIIPCFVIWKVADEGAARRHKLSAAPKDSINKLADQLKRMSTKNGATATTAVSGILFKDPSRKYLRSKRERHGRKEGVADHPPIPHVTSTNRPCGVGVHVAQAVHHLPKPQVTSIDSSPCGVISVHEAPVAYHLPTPQVATTNSSRRVSVHEAPHHHPTPQVSSTNSVRGVGVYEAPTVPHAHISQDTSTNSSCGVGVHEDHAYHLPMPHVTYTNSSSRASVQEDPAYQHPPTPKATSTNGPRGIGVHEDPAYHSPLPQLTSTRGVGVHEAPVVYHPPISQVTSSTNSVRGVRGHEAPTVPYAHIPQVASTNGPHASFGTASDEFAIGSNLSKKRKMNDKTAKARNSRRDSEGIELLRQIFPEEPGHELNTIHTAYLQKYTSNEAAHCSRDLELQAIETKTRIEKETARRWQSRRERMAYAENAVRADNDDGAINCRQTKKKLPKLGSSTN